MKTQDDVKIQRHLIKMRRLYHTLTYEGSLIALFAGYKLIGYGLLITILTITAVLYTPYLVKSLIEFKKWNWIISFTALIMIPLLLMLLKLDNIILRTVYSSIALLMFYLFCWILKFSVHNWIEKIEYAEMDLDY